MKFGTGTGAKFLVFLNRPVLLRGMKIPGLLLLGVGLAVLIYALLRRRNKRAARNEEEFFIPGHAGIHPRQ